MTYRHSPTCTTTGDCALCESRIAEAAARAVDPDPSGRRADEAGDADERFWDGQFGDVA